MRKLSRPWHGTYRVTALKEPDISVTKVYHPQSPAITVHQSRVKPCPLNFPAGFYWYGGNIKGPGRPPKWVEQLLVENSRQCDTTDTNEVNTNTEVTNQESDNDTEEFDSDTEESDDSTDCEDEEWSYNEKRLESQIQPAVNRRSTAHYGLRLNPLRSQRYS